MMKQRHTSLLILAMALAGASIFGTSCRTANTVQRKEPVAQQQPIESERINTDSSLGKAVTVVGVNEATAPGGFLQVQLEVVNRTSRAKRFTYRFTWFDENGIQIKQGQAIRARIHGGEYRSLTSTAPTPKAKDFRVTLLER